MDYSHDIFIPVFQLFLKSIFYLPLHSQTFQDLDRSSVLCFVDLSFKIRVLHKWHMDLFGDLPSIKRQNPPNEWSHRSATPVSSKHPQYHEHQEFREISRVNIEIRPSWVAVSGQRFSYNPPNKTKSIWCSFKSLTIASS